jgi:asparagine synthase (glutamine-hydrolysing)
MCGIAGIMRFTPGETPPPLLPVEWIRALDESVKHRGPDGRGVLVDRVFRPADAAGNSVAGWLDVALIHRRLAIIDLEGGAQPMVDPPVPGGLRGDAELTPLADDALAVVFNGCIYNHRALRAELIAGGATFSTDHSDTEVLLHGYRAWGEKLPERLEGMFAFVIWDRGAGGVVCGQGRGGREAAVLRYGAAEVRHRVDGLEHRIGVRGSAEQARRSGARGSVLVHQLRRVQA